MYQEVDPKRIKSGTINIRENVGNIGPIVRKIIARLEAGKRGIAVPLIVTPTEDKDYLFEVVDGERRLASALHVGLPTVPVYIEVDAEKNESLSWESYDANDVRLSNNWFEIGKFFSRENDNGMSFAKIAERAAMAKGSVQQYIEAYRKLSSYVRTYEIDSIMTARVIVDKIKDVVFSEADTQRIVDRVVEDKLSWRDTEALLDKVIAIRNEIYAVSNDKIRDQLFEEFEPHIYQDYCTLTEVKARKFELMGLSLWTSEKLEKFRKFVNSIEKLKSLYPESFDYQEGEDGDDMWIRVEGHISKKEFRTKYEED